MLLTGSDLIATRSKPGVWSEPDLDHILGRYGVLIIERAGVDVDQAVDTLARWRHSIYLIHQLIQNDVSSTKVRLWLYMDDGVTPNAAAGVIQAEHKKGKEKEMGTSSAAAGY